MMLTEEYLKENEKTVIANLSNKDFVIGPKHYQGRVRRIMEFIVKNRTNNCKILDIGSGAYMPVHMGATHACDITGISGDILEKSGWKGSFRVASCDDLPYNEKEFDVAICTEVLEHLPDLETVERTFKEIERVAHSWVVTTPKASKSGFRDKWNIEPTHKQFLTLEDIRGMVARSLPGIPCTFEEVEHYVFIMRVQP